MTSRYDALWRVCSPSSTWRASAPSRNDAARSLDLAPSTTSSLSFSKVTVGRDTRLADTASFAPDAPAFFARTGTPAGRGSSPPRPRPDPPRGGVGGAGEQSWAGRGGGAAAAAPHKKLGGAR